MTESPKITAAPWSESAGTCDCCGQSSKTIWGELFVPERTVAVYFVQWTIRSLIHRPNIDLIIGAWGEKSDPKERVLVSLQFQPSSSGGTFMVIDSNNRPSNIKTLCGKTLSRAEVIGTPLASEVFSLVDAIWLTEPRIAEVQELNHVA